MKNNIDYLKTKISKLEQSEEQFRGLYENATIGIFRSTPDGKIVIANPKFIDIVGYSSLEELKKIDIETELYADTGYRKQFKKIIEEEEVIHSFSSELVKRDGTKIHILESGRIIKDENHEVAYYEGTIEDITHRKKIELSLIRSEKKFRSIFENSGSGIAISTEHGLFVDVNPRFCQIFGYTKEELLTMTFYDLTHPDEIEKSKSAMSRLAEHKNENIQIEKRYIRKDGTIIWGSITVGKVIDEVTQEINNIGILEDITDRVNYLEKLNAREKVLSALSFSTETFLETLDWQANINEVLKRLGESLNVSRCYIFKNHLSDAGEVLTSQKYEWAKPGVKSNLNNQELQNIPYKDFDSVKILENLENNNPCFHITSKLIEPIREFLLNQQIMSFLLVPIFEAKQLWGFIGFDDCRYERMWTEQEIDALKTAGSLFSVAIKRKSFEEDLLKAKMKAEESEKLKSNFLAQMSHEIRSPINSILSFSNLLEHRMVASLDDELKSSFNIIASAGKRITRTIDLILNMSEVQTGTYEYSANVVDIYTDVLLTIINEFKILAKTKNLEFIVNKNTSDTVRTVDGYTVSQIFINLIDNALKYTSKGKIELTLDLNCEGKLNISVSDTGIGISKEYLPNLFNAFSQEEQGYTRKFEGNGLGLALVKNYCDMNNSTISVRSRKGIGSTFTVTF